MIINPMPPKIEKTYKRLLKEGKTCEAAYYAAIMVGGKASKSDRESAVGRAFIGGLRNRRDHKRFLLSYRNIDAILNHVEYEVRMRSWK